MSTSNKSISESLIEDLASGNVSAFPLSPDQELLSIPFPLVYLAGLVLSREESSRCGKDREIHNVSDFVQEQFRTYCEVYNKHLGSNDKPLQVLAVLSPRIRPTQEQQLIIQKDISNKAQALLHILLEKEEGQQEKENTHHFIQSIYPIHHEAFKTKKKKNSRQTCSLREGIQPSSVSRDIVTKEESLEQIIRMRLNTTSTLETENNDATDWISIPILARTATCQEYTPTTATKMKDRKTVHCSQVTKDKTGMEGSTLQGDLLASPIQADDFSSRITTVSGTDDSSLLVPDRSVNSALSINTEFPQHGSTKESWHERKDTGEGRPKVTNHHQRHQETEINSLETQGYRIRELEAALAESNRLLQEERQKHTQELKEEQERHVNSMQALQLRLYISETQLKTYQDALEEHIHSVAENVYHPTGSPPRRSCQEKERKSPPPVSPLISRVLQHTNRLQLDERK